MYSYNPAKKDTTHYFDIMKGKHGYTLLFHKDTTVYYKLVDTVNMKFDTVRMITQSSYGPYEYKKQGDRILFKEYRRDTAFRDLYLLTTEEYLAPNLFSSSSDSYTHTTKLLDQNAVLTGVNGKTACYKFLQTEMWYENNHLSVRTLFISKSTLLPIRIVYYSDLTMKTVVQDIFAK